MIAGWKRFDSERFWLFLLVALAAAIRVFFLLKFEGTDGGDPGMVTSALLILEDPRLPLNFDGNSSTLYRYAIASFMYFWRDPVLAPRVFTMIFGIFLLIPYYGTLKILFGRAVAFFSSLVLVFYPLHVIQSGMTSSDAVYYFFLFGAFYYFFGYLSGPKRFGVLGFSALLFNIASLLRFESWVFIPVFFFLLWPKGKRTAFLFFISSSVFVCVWLFLNQIFCHDFLYSLNAAARTARAEILAGRIVDYDPSLWSWLAILWKSSGPSLVIGGLLGMALAFLTRQKRRLAIFFLVLLAALTFNVRTARMWGGARYSIVLGLFLIPYAWFFAERVLTFLRIRRIIFFILCLVFPAISFIQTTEKIFAGTSEMFSFTPPEILRIAAWLKTNVRADETLVFEADPFDAFPNTILIRGGISLKRCEISYAPLYVKNDFQEKTTFKKYLLEKQPSYLVLNSEGSLRKVLDFQWERKTQKFDEMVLETLYEEDLCGYGKFIICKMSYPKALEGVKDGRKAEKVR